MDIQVRFGGTSYENYMELINRVFFPGKGPEFESLLPKLYRPELKPQDNNALLFADGVLRGAVGMYTRELQVDRHTLKAAGIGNVACDPAFEGNGFMRRMMELCLAAMKRSDADISDLGGDRQRYGYYGYECMGTALHFSVGKWNLKHAGSPLAPLTLSPMTEEEVPLAAQLHRGQNAFCLREEKEWLPILRTWHRTPYTVKQEGKPVGYCVLDGEGGVFEPFLTDANLYPSLLSACMPAGKDQVRVVLPPWRGELCALLEAIAQDVQIKVCENFLVLNYEKVLTAYMELAASIRPLADGELAVDICGAKKRERLLLQVKAGIPSVSPLSKDADARSLTHMEAQRLFFAPVCSLRKQLPPEIAAWFPLPLFTDSADGV